MRIHKGIQKRMKLTGGGKVKHARAKKSHLMSGMRGKKKRELSKRQVVKGTQAKTYRRLLGA